MADLWEIFTSKKVWAFIAIISIAEFVGNAHFVWNLFLIVPPRQFNVDSVMQGMNTKAEYTSQPLVFDSGDNRFVLDETLWVYVDGNFISTAKASASESTAQATLPFNTVGLSIGQHTATLFYQTFTKQGVGGSAFLYDSLHPLQTSTTSSEMDLQIASINSLQNAGNCPPFTACKFFGSEAYQIGNIGKMETTFYILTTPTTTLPPCKVQFGTICIDNIDWFSIFAYGILGTGIAFIGYVIWEKKLK